MNTVEQRYNFLIKHLKATDMDYWECDGLLEMKTLYFQFAEADVDKLGNIDFVIDEAMAAEEWDIAHGVIKSPQ